MPDKPKPGSDFRAHLKVYNLASIHQNNEFQGFPFHSPTHSAPKSQVPAIGWTVTSNRTPLWGICGHGEKRVNQGYFPMPFTPGQFREDTRFP